MNRGVPGPWTSAIGLAHRLELLSGFELGHGEAVAIGVALDTTYSYLAGLLQKRPWQRILDLLANLGFALYVPQLDQPRALLRGLEDFRAHLGGRLTVMLLWDIGQGLEVNDMEPQTVMAAIDLLRESAREGVNSPQQAVWQTTGSRSWPGKISEIKSRLTAHCSPKDAPVQIDPDGFFHLTYCTKVHPGCGWAELFGNLQALVPRLKGPAGPGEGPSAWACASPLPRAGNSWPGTT